MDKSFHPNNSTHPKVKSLIVQFNTSLLDFMNEIAVMRPRSTIGRRITLIRILLRAIKNRPRYLNVFVENVLEYKSQIDADDESFFLNKDYDEGKAGVESTLETDDIDMDELIVEIKTLWLTITQPEKDKVMAYMKLLCALAQDYFVTNMHLFNKM